MLRIGYFSFSLKHFLKHEHDIQYLLIVNLVTVPNTCYLSFSHIYFTVPKDSVLVSSSPFFLMLPNYVPRFFPKEISKLVFPLVFQ